MTQLELLKDREEYLKVLENELFGMREWIKENPIAYLSLPESVQNILVRGQVETKARITAMKNEYL